MSSSPSGRPLADARINAPLAPKTDADRVRILLDALQTAQAYVDTYCSCNNAALPLTSKTIRRALEACAPPATEVPS